MKQVVTSCKDCKFSIYSDKTQTGCEFDLLKKYKDAGIAIQECYDEEKEFSVVNRICMYSRNKSSTCSKEQVIEDVKIKYQVILILKDDNIDDFSSCLDSVINQDIPPQHITVVRKFDVNTKPFKITKLLFRSGIKWRYEDCQDTEFSQGDLIDSCIDSVVFPYYVVLTGNKKLSRNFSNRLNFMINEKFTKFSYLRGNNIDIVTTIFHKKLGGNAFMPLIEKIKNEKGLENTVLEMKDCDLWQQ